MKAKVEDSIHIDLILMISFFFRFIKIIIFVISCSYFFAMAFQLLITSQADYYNWSPYDQDELAQEDESAYFHQENFIEENKMN